MRRPAAPPTVHPDDAMRMLHLVRRSRRAAVVLTVGIATVSFVLSFTSLQELAAMSAWPGWKSWLWPVILDGLIILATLGIVSLAPYRDQFWNRLVLVGRAQCSGTGEHRRKQPARLACHRSPSRVDALGLGGFGVCSAGGAAGDHAHPGDLCGGSTRHLPPTRSSQAQASALAIAAERADKWIARGRHDS